MRSITQKTVCRLCFIMNIIGERVYTSREVAMIREHKLHKHSSVNYHYKVECKSSCLTLTLT